MNNSYRAYLLIFLSLILLSESKILAQGINKSSDTISYTFDDKNPLHLVNLNGVDLAIRYKKGVGTPIIFIHGSWDDHHSWMPVAELISSAVKNPVILYDRRGHSASSPDIKQGTISQDVKDLVLLTENLGFDKVHLIGHSYGANIAVQSATEYPEIVESIVLYEPPMFGLLKGKTEYKEIVTEIKLAMTTAKSLLEKGEIEKGTIHFTEKVAFGKDSWQTIFDERARSTMTAGYRTWLDQSNDPERLNIQPEKLKNFSGEITVIHGTHSIPIYPKVVKELKSKVEKIKTESISGAGHGGIVSHKKETAEIILKHLKRSE